MPKCVTCGTLLGPNFCIIVNESTDERQCVFCHLGKDEITVESDKTGESRKIKKHEAAENYRIYLKKLYESEKVQEIINPGNKSNIIKP